jgi:hypothetical protein
MTRMRRMNADQKKRSAVIRCIRLPIFRSGKGHIFLVIYT